MDKKNKGAVLKSIVSITLIVYGMYGGKYKVLHSNEGLIKTVLSMQKSNNDMESNTLEYLPLGKDPYADDAKVIEKEIFRWNFQRADNQKVAYLTFDDGPSEDITPQILDILKNNNVKATFFVLGSSIDRNAKTRENLKRIVRAGCAIGNHGYSHRYDILYPGGTVNEENFITDIKKAEGVIKSVLGENFQTRVIRFPGGHSSWHVGNIDYTLHSQNYVVIDWNTINGDSEQNNVPADRLLERLKYTVTAIEGNNDTIVVLMHDKVGKETTVEYLQKAIDYLRAKGYVFRTLK